MDEKTVTNKPRPPEGAVPHGWAYRDGERWVWGHSGEGWSREGAVALARLAGAGPVRVAECWTRVQPSFDALRRCVDVRAVIERVNEECIAIDVLGDWDDGPVSPPKGRLRDLEYHFAAILAAWLRDETRQRTAWVDPSTVETIEP